VCFVVFATLTVHLLRAVPVCESKVFCLFLFLFIHIWRLGIDFGLTVCVPPVFIFCVCVLLNVCACLSCHVALSVGVAVHLRPLTHTPPLRSPRWLRWESTYGVHGLDHPGCRGDIGRLLLQAVGLFVDSFYLDVWFTEGNATATWKTIFWIKVRIDSSFYCQSGQKSSKTTVSHSIFYFMFFHLSDPLFSLFLSLLIMVHYAIWSARCLNKKKKVAFSTLRTSVSMMMKEDVRKLHNPLISLLWSVMAGNYVRDSADLSAVNLRIVLVVIVICQLKFTQMFW